MSSYKEVNVAVEIIQRCSFDTPRDSDTVFSELITRTTLQGFRKIRAKLTNAGILAFIGHKGIVRAKKVDVYDVYVALGYVYDDGRVESLIIEAMKGEIL